ncbi:DUF397 domain-containing protein [Streptomyces alfalfae]|uniref:DUF397 domain-containing protein n=1 Tax=Streptomyces alfalfae TaxID=1642299 RepID=A0ABM6GSR9_9ACTN|nr:MULTISPECIES: DUF397 domain-containing protein [Streptomyces]AYA17412.1 DUF397 domain-containing protein [Streptomyces fradiae]APY87021.1 DUF397 domain-containing protein [Streptomyces alfalfae]QUI33205.1 DUF397 domain-containing protein [Streptomyces alfalfae]RXX37079.1 DUF397 domain-containing protein [Streptomyces alfalfae]RZM87333.1 DUF397 domain-containing protein [Streptomyces alfalfae]
MNTAMTWFKSSYSGDEGGQCLEAAYTWRKSSHSGSEGGQCVEVATHPTAIHIRDSKNPEGPALTVTPEAWTSFLTVSTQADAGL